MSIFNDIENDLKVLLHQEVNLKKSIYKKFKLDTLNAKLTYATELFNNIEEKLLQHQDNLSSSEVTFIAKAARNAFHDIKSIIDRKIKEDKMTQNTVFDIKTATAIIQPYDGSADNLNAFVDATNLLKELTPENHHQMLVKFLKTRITGKARIGLPANLNTVDEVVADIKRRCEERTSPDHVLAKLKQIKHTGDNITFCNEVETLTNKLKGIYLEKQIPENVAQEMATKAGVETIIDKTTNLETKIILKAGSFGTITEAIQKLNENCFGSNTTQIMRFNTVGQQRSYPRQSNNRNSISSFQRNRQFNNQHRNNNYNNNYGNNYRNRQENNRNNNQPWRGRNPRSENNHNSQQNFRNGSRVFYTQTGNPSGPQHQHQVGGPPMQSVAQHMTIPPHMLVNQLQQGDQALQPMIYYQNSLNQAQPRQ